MLCNNVDVEKKGIDNVFDTYKSSKPEYNIISEDAKSNNLYNSIGIVLYIIFVSASMSCGFILEDERLNTKERILLSKVSEKQYYGAQLILYFFTSSIPVIEYFIICKVVNFNLGFNSEFILLLVTYISITGNIISIISIFHNKK